MNSKLTLSLKGSAIKRAKRYAKERHISLSKMVENFFQSITSSNQDILDRAKTPIVDELIGTLNPKDTTRWKDGYANYLNKKYFA